MIMPGKSPRKGRARGRARGRGGKPQEKSPTEPKPGIHDQPKHDQPPRMPGSPPDVPPEQVGYLGLSKKGNRLRFWGSILTSSCV